MPDEEQEQNENTDTDAEETEDTTSDNSPGGSEDDRGMFDMMVDAGTLVATGGLIDINPEEGQPSKSEDD